MRGILLVLVAVLMASTVYFVVSTKHPVAPDNDRSNAGRRDAATGTDTTITPLTGGPVDRAAKTNRPGTDSARNDGPDQQTGRHPGLIPASIGREERAQITFDRALDPELSMDQRVEQVKEYIALTSKYLPKDEVARRVLELLAPDRDVTGDGSFRGSVLGLLQGLKSETLVATLFDNVRDRRAKVRLGALTALAAYPENDAVRKNVRQLLRGEPDPDVRAKAQAILAMDPGAGEQGEPDKGHR